MALWCVRLLELPFEKYIAQHLFYLFQIFKLWNIHFYWPKIVVLFWLNCQHLKWSRMKLSVLTNHLPDKLYHLLGKHQIQIVKHGLCAKDVVNSCFKKQLSTALPLTNALILTKSWLWWNIMNMILWKNNHLRSTQELSSLSILGFPCSRLVGQVLNLETT